MKKNLLGYLETEGEMLKMTEPELAMYIAVTIARNETSIWLGCLQHFKSTDCT